MTPWPGSDLPSESVEASPSPFSPVRIGPLVLRNRFIKAATFEGMADDGLVSDRLVEFHRSVAAGGVAMTTLAFLAVCEDGKGAPGEIVVDERSATGLQRLADAVHSEGALVAGQIGHAGPVAAALGARGLAPSRVWSPMTMRTTREATVDDIGRIVGAFGAAAGKLAQSGFDAIELHVGHGYLLSSFLSPVLNRRDDQYGGDVLRRAELARRVASAARAAVPSDVAVLAKLNLDDGAGGDTRLGDVIDTIRLLERDGTLDAITLTGGSSFRDPMFLMRGNAPVRELADAFPQPLRTAIRVGGRRFLRTYPFAEGFFLDEARRVRAATTIPLIALGGINRLRTVETALADGFAAVSLARALLNEPGLVNRWQSGDVRDGGCTHCNRCMPTIYRGTHCTEIA